MSNEHNPAQAFLNDNNLKFENSDLMTMALTHPSYSQERCTNNNNQRLEFLGDAVLNFMIAEYLYNNYSQKAEGELTKIRARVVCENALTEVAREINIGKYIRLGKGEEMSGGRKRKSILADTVESVIGAIYLDQGLGCARSFILKHLEKDIKETVKGEYQDYKSRLQELVQARSRKNVTYNILEESGPAHARNFVAGVFFNNQLLAKGSGKSKKEAEQRAASQALKNETLIFTIGLEHE